MEMDRKAREQYRDEIEQDEDEDEPQTIVENDEEEDDVDPSKLIADEDDTVEEQEIRKGLEQLILAYKKKLVK